MPTAHEKTSIPQEIPETNMPAENDSLTSQGEWFGVLNNAQQECKPRRVPRALLENAYLVVFKDAAIPSAVQAAIESRVDKIKTYRRLPLIEIECAEEKAQEVAGLPEVEWVVPALGNISTLRSIAKGLDVLSHVAELQRQSISTLGVTLIGGRTPGEAVRYPVVRREGNRLELRGDATIDWSPLPAIMPVVNMSLGSRASDYPFLKNDIVNVATFSAAVSGQLVVVAAGNCGNSEEGVETMSAWAQAPWVVAVGATEDAEGEALASYSSRGAPDDPQSGPDVVSWGQSAISNRKKDVGTSFAAPRVTFYAMVCAAALLELRHGMQAAVGQASEGVRLVGCGFVDNFADEINWSATPRVDVPALPVTGLNTDHVEALARLAANHRVAVNIQGNAAILRALLLNAARPMDGYEGHEVGRGFLSEQVLLDYLAQLTGADILSRFATEESPPELMHEASRLRVFDRFQLGDLTRIVGATAPVWNYDWRKNRLGGRPFFADGAATSGMTDFEFTYGEMVD